MVEVHQAVNPEYERDGYLRVAGAFSSAEIAQLNTLLSAYYSAWIETNEEAFRLGAINAAYLTAPDLLSPSQRETLFQFLGSRALMAQVNAVFDSAPCFMNTQLFFDPADPAQANYWHRDPQYHLDECQQRAALTGPEVVHFRIATKHESGIELVPGSHRRWDTPQQWSVRMGLAGRQPADDLTGSERIALEPGDLLIFSANMLHRGLYGGQRLALDVLFCDPDPSLLEFLSRHCLPGPEAIAKMDMPSAFLNTLALMADNHN